MPRVFLALCLLCLCAPATAQQWTTVYGEGTRAQEAGSSPAGHKTAPDIVGVETAHDGGNRILWRLSFAEPFVTEGVVLILYLDVDSDEKTGRTGFLVQGTDRMLTFIDGEPGSSVHSSAGGGRRTTARIEDGKVVFSDDLGLLGDRIRAAREAGKSEIEFAYRARVLCHKAANGADADDTPWFTVSTRIDLSKPRPMDSTPGKSLVSDLVERRAADDVIELRFTTSEPVFATVVGPQSALARHGKALQRNHAWALTRAPKSGPINYRIELADDLGQHVETVSRTYRDKPRANANEPTDTRQVKLSLNVDREALAARKDPLQSVKWPVSGGVPFPKGELFSPDRVRLLDAAGKEREMQVEPLARWEGGSIRWLLVELIASLPRDLSGEFTLEFGRSVKRVARKPTKQNSGIRDLWTDSLSWKGGEGAGRSTKTPPIQEKLGALHQVYAMGSRYSCGGGLTPFGYHARVHLYPDLPFVRIEHTLTVEDGDPMAYLKSLRLLFPRGGTVAEPVSALEPTSEKARGFVTSGKAFLAVRNLAENWPKAIAGEGDRIAVDLFPELSPEQYINRKEPQEKLYYWFDNGFYKLRRGLHKTHEILYARDASGVPTESLAYWFENLPVLTASPEWACASGAAGPLKPRDSGSSRVYDRQVMEGFDRVEKARVTGLEYGLLNFGDWYGERGRNWGNGEYDFAHGLWLEWLRSGDYRCFRRAEQAASHMGDIDVVHSDADSMNVGRMWAHALGHTGGYYPDGAFGMEWPFTRGYWDTGHTWTEGMLHLYLATGEKPFLDNALLVADQLAGPGTAEFRMSTERQGGWPIIALVAAYEVTGDAYYLNGAKIAARVSMAAQDPKRGGWFYRIGECKHDPPHVGGKTFMSGVLATGLSRLHRVLSAETEEDRRFRDGVKASILKGCDWMLDEAWMEDYQGFFYAQCPEFYSRACTAAPWMVSEALAYATRVSGDPKYADRAMRAMDKVLQGSPPGIGKYLAMEMRSTPHFYAMIR